MSMKVIKKDVQVHLHGLTFTCDIVLGVYVNGKRPAITLVEAASIPNGFGEVVAVASTNAPPEYLTGMPQHYFAGKDYAENEGLWDQLESLTEDDGASPLFMRTSKRLTLGHVRVSIYALGPAIQGLFEELLEEIG